MRQEQKEACDTESDKGRANLTRRTMLAKLGLLGIALYAAPALVTLSDAKARTRSDRSRNDRSRNRGGRNRNRNGRNNRTDRTRSERN